MEKTYYFGKIIKTDGTNAAFWCHTMAGSTASACLMTRGVDWLSG